MREFIYFSRTAPTSGSYIKEDLEKAGRLDIAIHSVIAAFFLSHKMREDVKLHLIFTGMPDPPKHLELKPILEGETGVDKIYLSKKNISGVIKRMLYKYKEGEKREIYPGYWIEKKGFLEIIKELHSQGRQIFVMDPDGEDIRSVKMDENPIFIIGDHRGLPGKEYKRLKDLCTPISIGKRTYFASHTIAVINNEVDRREDGTK
ncbi:MAG: tRNA (pseudouridine(54)-N(1))-methyltransferase TrmY [Nanoarchaeota archaeon]